MALDGFLITCKQVLKCREILEELVANNSIKFLGVPGHFNFLGDEKADILANRGSKGLRATYCSERYAQLPSGGATKGLEEK